MQQRYRYVEEYILDTRRYSEYNNNIGTYNDTGICREHTNNTSIHGDAKKNTGIHGEYTNNSDGYCEYNNAQYILRIQQ